MVHSDDKSGIPIKGSVVNDQEGDADPRWLEVRKFANVDAQIALRFHEHGSFQERRKNGLSNSSFNPNRDYRAQISDKKMFGGWFLLDGRSRFFELEGKHRRR